MCCSGLEKELLLIASYYIEKDTERRTTATPRTAGSTALVEYVGIPNTSASAPSSSTSAPSSSTGAPLNIASYAHKSVDRFAVLYDLWSHEAAYMESKRQVIISCTVYNRILIGWHI